METVKTEFKCDSCGQYPHSDTCPNPNDAVRSEPKPVTNWRSYPVHTKPIKQTL